MIDTTRRLPARYRRSGASWLMLGWLLLTIPALLTTPASAQQVGTLLIEPEAFEGTEGIDTIEQSFVHEGIAVTFRMEPVYPARRLPGKLRQGDDVVFRFKINDTATEAPATSVFPAAWMDLSPEGEAHNDQTCLQKAELYIGGSLFSNAELDLNVYYVLALNDDASITVVDPLFGFGGTKMLAMIPLQSPGHDWALTANQTKLFVSMPDSHRVAVVETAGWQVTATLDAGPRPMQVALQPDEYYLWVGNDTDDESAGVTVVTTGTQQVAARIPTGAGPHELAFTYDNRFAFVTNAGAGTVSVIDVRTLQKIKDIATGSRPTSIAYSPIADAVYVADAVDGAIVAIDAYRHRIVAQMPAEPGLGQIRFAPGGRLGFVVNPDEDVVHILDASTNRIVQTGDMEKGPNRLSFSDELAYVLHRHSETVLMIPLDEVGVEGAPMPVIDFPGGDNPPGQTARPSAADLLVQAPGANAVLVANPTDKTIYYYKEGMAAPMGSFSNYGRQPRAVQVVDRSLRQRAEPGVYETVARLRSPGRYDVVFFLDAPRIVRCFAVSVMADPLLEQEVAGPQVAVTPLEQDRLLRVGQSTRLSFRLTDPGTQTPYTDLRDVTMLTLLAPGIWHKRHPAEHLGDGVYAIDFVPPAEGMYYVSLASATLGLTLNNPHQLILQATNQEHPTQE